MPSSFTRSELYDLVWSEPMMALAKRFKEKMKAGLLKSKAAATAAAV